MQGCVRLVVIVAALAAVGRVEAQPAGAPPLPHPQTVSGKLLVDEAANVGVSFELPAAGGDVALSSSCRRARSRAASGSTRPTPRSPRRPA